MTLLAEFEADAPELEAIYEDLHAHPELGFEETRTAGVVAARLRKIGVDEVHEGVGGTGVVALIRGQGGGNRRVGTRSSTSTGRRRRSSRSDTITEAAMKSFARSMSSTMGRELSKSIARGMFGSRRRRVRS